MEVFSLLSSIEVYRVRLIFKRSVEWHYLHACLPEEEKKELSKRIDAYLKEIDHCLALLNQ